MLNSVTGKMTRQRLTAEDRRRQLISIGLSRLAETPIQDLSLDDVASEAGISRGLLFHYFATKTDFYVACIEAAGRRVLRNTAPSADDPGEAQVETMTRLMLEQVDRRREFYLSLVHGSGVTDRRQVDIHESLRTAMTERVMNALGLDQRQRPIVRGWWAYVEERALDWSGEPAAVRATRLTVLVRHCCDALNALLRIDGRSVVPDH